MAKEKTMEYKNVICAEELPKERTSLRSVLSTLYPDGMPEYLIAHVLKGVISGLNHVKSVLGRGVETKEPVVNAGRIVFESRRGVEFWRNPYIVELAYHENHMKPAWENPDVGIHGAGFLVLELTYGSLPKYITPREMVTLWNNMVKLLKQKLEDVDNQKPMKKLPNSLLGLLDDDYIDRRQFRKQQLKKVKKNGGVMPKGEEPHRDSDYRKKDFSRDFLEFLLKCLDNKDNPTRFNQIMELPFLPKYIDDEQKNVINKEEVPEETSLRSILRSHFPYGLPEESIALLLKGTIRGLNHIIAIHGGRGTEPVVNSRRIAFHWGDVKQEDHVPFRVQLAYHENHMLQRDAGHSGGRLDVGIRGVGILALELAFGSLPENLTQQQMAALSKKMATLLMMKLWASNQKAKKKLRANIYAQLHIDNIYRRKLLKEGLVKENAGGVDQHDRRTEAFMEKTVAGFSRDFLEFVLKCLYKEKPSTPSQTMDLPFIRNCRNDWDILFTRCEDVYINKTAEELLSPLFP